MKDTKNEFGLGSWTISTMTLVLLSLFSLINLSEYIKVGVLRHNIDYPFGWEGIWYYKTAQLYSIQCLYWGLIFLFPLIFTIVSTIKRKSKTIKILSVLTIVLVIIFVFRNGTDSNF